MPLLLHEVRRLAIEVAHAEDAGLEVIGVVTPSGGAGYTEVLVSLSSSTREESLITVGLDRRTSEAGFRSGFENKLRAHVQEYRRASSPRVRAAGR